MRERDRDGLQPRSDTLPCIVLPKSKQELAHGIIGHYINKPEFAMLLDYKYKTDKNHEGSTDRLLNLLLNDYELEFSYDR